ncbi:hypothetical protein ACFWNC_14545 [Streptomyces sp. NPDC058369]|uniref:hypothetical protein n=1 Tax=Streptomyces sp. NPDC058369 TaxID=3346462 RepID=UPI003655F409
MLDLLKDFGPTLAGLLALLWAGRRVSTSAVWKEEAAAWEHRANRLIIELEDVKRELVKMEGYSQALVRLLTSIDPEKLEELRNRGL